MPAPPEPPFRPRLRTCAFLRRLRGPPRSAGASNPLALVALAGTLFCFYRVFVALGGVRPAGEATVGPMTQAGPAIVWFLLGSGCAGLLALALERRMERRTGLKPGAVATLAREGWTRARRWAHARRGGTGAPDDEGPEPAHHVGRRV